MAIYPVRIYRVPTDQHLNWFYSLFQTKRELVIDATHGDKKYKLRSLVRELRWAEDESLFKGLFAYENLRFVKNLDGSVIATVDVDEAPFVFIEGSIFLLVFSRKSVAETTSIRLNSLIGGSVVIRNLFFDPNDIEQFLDENDHIMKRCTWKGLRIPGVDRANLGGSNVKRSADFTRFDRLGDKNYILIELLNENMTITISSSGALGFVSKVTQDEAIDFFKRKILPLIWI